jgi:hypothetical protein
MKHRWIQISLISGAIILAIGLVFAPRLPKEKRGLEINPIDLQIQEAVELVPG